jgi:hypothetical protein
MSRLNSVNACYQSMQKISSSIFLFKNKKTINYTVFIVCLHVKLDLTVREKHRLRMFENRLLRKLFGPKRDVVTRECRQLHKKELDDLYC